MNILDSLAALVTESGFAGVIAAGGWKNFVMMVVSTPVPKRRTKPRVVHTNVLTTSLYSVKA